MIKKFQFTQNAKGEWYLNLAEWKGDPADLQMVEGADKWLELLAGKDDAINVTMATEKFHGAETLTLLHIREPNLGGGGIYYLDIYKRKKVELKLWLCEVTKFVFGSIPQKIYFKVNL